MTKNTEASERSTSCGSCQVDRISPQDFSSATQKINIYLSFAEANRLKMAIEERLREIHKLKRSSKEAKSAAVNLVIGPSLKNIAIMPGKLTGPEN